MATITETGTIDLKAQKKAHDEAAKTATNYITADSTGITIRMSSSATTYQKLTSTDTTWYTSGKKRSNVSADGLKVFIGNAGSEVQVASLGADILLGKPGDCKVSITSSGMDVISSQSGEPIISAKIRNDETTGLVELHFVDVVGMTVLDNQTKYVIDVRRPIHQLKKISLYGTNGSIAGTVYANDSTKIIVSSAFYNKLVDVTFTTEDIISSVGVGEESASRGPESIAIGRSSTYGEASLAAGESTAYGERSVAIGGGASVGYGSLAAGGYTLAVGVYSQAFGYETIANGGNQTVIGEYNAPSNTDLFQVGNGTSDSDRSNAFSVSQTGIALASGNIRTKDTAIDRDGANPSTDLYTDEHSFEILDKDNMLLARVRSTESTNGTINAQMIAWNTDSNNSTVYNVFSVGIKKDGTRVYSVSDAPGFRNALGATSGVFPRSAGGTGMSARTAGTVTRTGLSTEGTFMAYSNGVINTIAAFSCKLKTALTAGSEVELATLPDGYRPPTNMYATVASSATAGTGRGFVLIDSNGSVTFHPAVAWSTTATIAFTISWAK